MFNKIQKYKKNIPGEEMETPFTVIAMSSIPVK